MMIDDHPAFNSGTRTMRPKCPSCGEWSTMTDERFGGKFECLDCKLWSWGGKPLADAATHKARREAWKANKKRPFKVLNLDEPEWCQVLGVKEDATPREITHAYRMLVLVHHPDRGGEIEKMIELNNARAEALRTR